MDEEKTEEKTEETASESLPEENKENKENEAQNLNTLVFDLKKQYEEKIENITKSKNDEIKARDDIIKQLLNGNSKMSAKATIADKINKNRNFKKW